MLRVVNQQRIAKIYIALELSTKSWVVGLSDGSRDSLKRVPARDLDGLLAVIAWFRRRRGLPDDIPVLCVYEAGPDGFSVARALRQRGLECLVIDSASIETSRHRRRAKTDNLDAKAMLRLVARYDQGEGKALRVVHEPSFEAEDARELERERKKLTGEVNRCSASIGSLLCKHGVALSTSQIGNLTEDALDEITTLDGRPLGKRLKERLARTLQRLTLARSQRKAIEAQQKQLMRVYRKRSAGEESPPKSEPLTEQERESLRKVDELIALRGIGLTGSWTLVHEFFGWRTFNNRKELGGASGMTPTPYDSGFSRREQGISKAGNHHVRTLMVELAWLWLRYQPGSELTRWYNARWGTGGRSRRIGIVALARKLLVALWRYLEHGVVPAGAVMKS